MGVTGGIEDCSEADESLFEDSERGLDDSDVESMIGCWGSLGSISVTA